MEKIKIKKSKNADTRSCDFSKVSKQQLLDNSVRHREDVKKGMQFLAKMLNSAGIRHDWTKISRIDDFHSDFTNGFREGYQEWYKSHQNIERHHLKNPKYIQNDVNLIDILEMTVDCVMAGLARNGEYREEEIPKDLLKKAYNNTVKLLLNNVELIDKH